MVVVLVGIGELVGEGITGVFDGAGGWGVEGGGPEGVEEGVYDAGGCVSVAGAGLVKVGASTGVRVAVGRGGRWGT